MVWLVGAVLVVLLAASSAAGAHAGPHGILGSALSWILGVAWFLAAVTVGAGSGAAWWLAGTAAGVSLASAGLALPALRARSVAPHPRRLPGAGEPGRAVTALDPVGVVQVAGESWTAESVSGPVDAGAEVRVVSMDGVKLRVWADEGAL